MSAISTFDGSGDIVNWGAKIVARLISKGYKSQLADANRPAGDPARANWDAQADKATGVILTFLEPEIAVQFQAQNTPQTLLAALTAHFHPDLRQEVDRLENELTRLTYDGSDPVAWVGKVRGLVAKLAAKQAAPNDRTVRNLVLRALEQEPKYLVRVEIIRHSNPDITLADLWLAVARLPYPLESVDSAFAALNLTSNAGGEMNSSAKYIRNYERGRGRGGPTQGRGGGRGVPQAPAPAPIPPPQQQQQPIREQGSGHRGGGGWRGRGRGRGGYEPPAYTPEDEMAYAQRKSDFAKGACFLCHGEGHKSGQCPLKGKRKDKVSEGEENLETGESSDRGKGRGKPHTYNYFVQDVVMRDVDQPHTVKSARREAPTATTTTVTVTDMPPSPIPAVQVQQQVQQKQQVAPQVVQQVDAPTPARKPATFKTVQKWYDPIGSSASVHLDKWWVTDSFSAAPITDTHNIAAATWGDMSYTVPTEAGIQQNDVLIIPFAGGDNAMVYKDDLQFGALELPGHTMYRPTDIVKLVLMKIDDEMRGAMQELEAEIEENAGDPDEFMNHHKGHTLYIVWREAALNVAVIRTLFDNVTQLNANDVLWWMRVAGLDGYGNRCTPLTIADAVRALVRDRVVEHNFDNSVAELIKHECLIQMEWNKHFGWLTDLTIGNLAGTSMEAMIGDQVPTMEMVVGRLTFLLSGKKTGVSLFDVHKVLSEAMAVDQRKCMGILGMYACNSVSAIDLDSPVVQVAKGEKYLSQSTLKVVQKVKENQMQKQQQTLQQMQQINNSDVKESNCVTDFNNDKNVLSINECMFTHTTPNSKHEEQTLHWYSDKVAEALKHSDLSAVWVADSGATKHMTDHKEWVTELKPTNSGVKTGGGHILPAAGVGKVSITVVDEKGITSDITLNDVLLVPGIKVNLLSIPRMAVHGKATIVYEGATMQLKPNGLNSETIGVGKFVNKEQLYVLDCTVNSPEVSVDKCFAAMEKGSESYTQLMHKRLSHTSASKMNLMHKTAVGVKQMMSMKPHNCTICAEMKQRKKAISKVAIPNAIRVLGRIHIDLGGPYPKSERGNRYNCTVTDSNTRRRWLLLLKRKEDAFKAFSDWATMIEAKTGEKIGCIRCDNGGEFDNEVFITWARRQGYTFERTAPYTPSQNGVAERYNGVLGPAIASMLRQHKVPKNMWDYAAEHGNEIQNMLPCKTIDDKAPAYMWTGKAPDVSRLRVFGCLAYGHLDGRKLPKLAPKAVPCAYLGHSLTGDGFKLWNWKTDKVIVCRSVEFFEGKSGFYIPEAKGWMKTLEEELLWGDNDSSSEEEEEMDDSSIDSAENDDILNPEAPRNEATRATGINSPILARNDVIGANNVNPAPRNGSTGAASEKIDISSRNVNISGQNAPRGMATHSTSSSSARNGQNVSSDTHSVEGEGQVLSPPSVDDDNEEEEEPGVLRRTRRRGRKQQAPESSSSSTKHKTHDVSAPVYKGQEAIDTNVHSKTIGIQVKNLRNLPSRAAATKTSGKESAFIMKEMDMSELIADEYGLVVTMTGQLPETIAKFKEAMIAEIQAITDMEVYEEVDVTRGTHVISVKWVLKEKKATSLTPAKLKARLVARGFTQTKGINYEETHAPVARIASMRATLAVSAAKGWVVEQLDVQNAYLNGEMDMPGVYIRQPPYFIDPLHPRRVWLLLKGLYGTKQGGKIWYETFTGHLTEEVGLIAHASDPCLFTSVDENGEVNAISSIYVDDAIIGGEPSIVKEIKARIAAKFPIKDLGVAKHVVGIQVEQLPEGTLLSQAAYIDEILELTGQEDCHATKTPMSKQDASYSMVRNELNEDSPEFRVLSPNEHHTYREYVGKLMYLMVCTRPDIAFAVNFLARANAAPEQRHMNSVINVVRYLKGTRRLGIMYPRIQEWDEEKLDLVAYVDAAFADCLTSRKSTGGYLTCLNGAPLTWQSSRQTVVTTSSTEAEYVAAAEGTKEVIWLRKMFEDMGCVIQGPTVMFEDNNSCIAQTENPLHHKRTKHIDVSYHFTRQMVEEDLVVLEKVGTEDQVADMLTKPLCKALFHKHLEMLKMRSTKVLISKE